MAKLPILMYHNVCADNAESRGLTISIEKLEEQFQYLVSKGYTSIFFSEMEFNNSPPPKKPIIITFDDVYVNQLKHAYPLLQKYNLKASFFVPFAYVGGYDDWNDGIEKIMTVEQLKSMDSSVIELGLHSFKHHPYDGLTSKAVELDFQECQDFIQNHNLDIKNILAYPYGKFPRETSEKARFFNQLMAHKIAYGLRIGNRINRLPLKTKYELNRLDIKGDMSLSAFRFKVKFGKVLF
ncbi:MAG: Poly-beta-1,6-N-acetyl-D-glucosamine N-deacetylase [Formosa sp. Hel3_A1_48]|nr:MAG: Poly-beta-1,6-N-acetyl-D-glucosamine N-deacetylase [Formosa sp. Hel3_A1_48]